MNEVPKEDLFEGLKYLRCINLAIDEEMMVIIRSRQIRYRADLAG